MKIYFCGSITAGRGDVDIYNKMINHLKTYGTVLTEDVGNKKITESDVDPDKKAIHDKCLQWMEDCDVVIAEVTQPSLGVGYEIAQARVMKKPILCLFRPESNKNLSSMIEGAKDGKDFIVKYYKENEGIKVISEYMKRFKSRIEEEGK